MPVKALAKLVSKDLVQVNKIILREAKNDVDLIPRLAKHLIDAGGKRVRPLLTLACARMCGYDGKRHVNLAAVVEFMHTATLLHDDVVDESAMRRGRKTANNIWGNKASVLVGDYLLGRAFQMMTADGSLKVLRILSDAAAKIAEGEVLQLSTTGNLRTSYETYLQVVRAKTAELFSAACAVGGAIVEDEEKQKALAEYGECFGIAFQISDDILDYNADEKKLGKNVGDDLREGKITLPVIFAYHEGSREDKKFWKDVMQNPGNLTTEKMHQAREIIKKTHSLEYCAQRAAEFGKRANNSLAVFPDSKIKSVLIDLVNHNVNRDH